MSSLLLYLMNARFMSARLSESSIIITSFIILLSSDTAASSSSSLSLSSSSPSSSPSPSPIARSRLPAGGGLGGGGGAIRGVARAVAAAGRSAALALAAALRFSGFASRKTGWNLTLVDCSCVLPFCSSLTRGADGRIELRPRPVGARRGEARRGAPGRAGASSSVGVSPKFVLRGVVVMPELARSKNCGRSGISLSDVTRIGLSGRFLPSSARMRMMLRSLSSSERAAVSVSSSSCSCSLWITR